MPQTRNYGDPAAEYAAAMTDAVLHERTDRALLRVYGRDPQRIVQGIVTNDVANVPADRVVYAALLTPKGRMVADVRVIRRDADLLLDVPAAALDALLALFKRTIPPLFAKFENITDTHALIGLYGPRSLAVLESFVATTSGSSTAGLDLSGLPLRDGLAVLPTDGGTIVMMTTGDTGTDGVELIVPGGERERVCDALTAAGASKAGASTIDVLRIEAGTPRWGAELDETTIPLEADLLERAISTNKGCYTGQEVIIRVLHRGHVNWHLRGVLLGDAATPARGTQLFAAATGRAVGRITSAAWSPKYRQTIALAYVRREIEPPATLQLGSPDGTAAGIVTLPFAAATLP